jgi:hypothetical protein
MYLTSARKHCTIWDNTSVSDEDKERLLIIQATAQSAMGSGSTQPSTAIRNFMPPDRCQNTVTNLKINSLFWAVENVDCYELVDGQNSET